MYVSKISLYNLVLSPSISVKNTSNILPMGHRETFIIFSPIMLNYATASWITQYVILQFVIIHNLYPLYFNIT